MPSPPDLADPERSRPYVHYLNVDPPLGEPIQVNLSDTSTRSVTILLPFQSEDLGENIGGSLHLYGADDSIFIEYTTSVSAGEFSSVRNARMTWNAGDNSPGCYRLTATLAHASSFGDNGFVPQENQDDAEAVSWVANVWDPETGDINKLSECPRIGGVN